MKAGMNVARVEIENGKIIVFAGGAGPDETKNESNTDEWDNVP